MLIRVFSNFRHGQEEGRYSRTKVAPAASRPSGGWLSARAFRPRQETLTSSGAATAGRVASGQLDTTTRSRPLVGEVEQARGSPHRAGPSRARERPEGAVNRTQGPSPQGARGPFGGSKPGGRGGSWPGVHVETVERIPDEDGEPEQNPNCAPAKTVRCDSPRALVVCVP